MAGSRTYIGLAYYDSQQPVTAVLVVTLDSTFLFKMASSSADPFPEDSTTRVLDNQLLSGPTNL